MNLNSAERTKILGRVLYNGVSPEARTDMVVEVQHGRILAVRSYAAAEDPVIDIESEILTPGLIDMQINGAKDVQFNDNPTVAGLRTIAEGAAKGGTAFLLPTYITDHDQNYRRALEAVSQAISEGVPGILGVHLEGPFLSHKRPGIHDQSAIRPIAAEDLETICAPFPGVQLVTLAPEEASDGAIEALSKAGVVVFAGHSQATEAEMIRAIDAGLTGATHLFNAMSQVQPREPGVVGTVLTNEQLFAGIIADGKHVSWSNVRLAVAMMPDRLCLVTDAMLTLAGETTKFDLHGETIRLQNGQLQNPDGTLAGAHVAMDESIRNLIDEGIACPGHAVRMATSNPAKALGLQDQIGQISEGFRGVFTSYDSQWNANAVLR